MTTYTRIRAYLLKTLRGLGLQPIVQQAAVASPMPQWFSSGSLLRVSSQGGVVYNVMARIKGKQGGKALLLLAHYDSQPNTLGAADNGAGVAAILETVRAIRRQGPLQRDLIVLFTDAEEVGLFGAKAFLRHPWAADVGFVMNLDARGNRGPSLTGELSAGNGWIVEQLAQAAPYPRASSLMYEVYRSMPNASDFTLFREAGYAGTNSGILDGFIHYHKLTDSPQNLSLNSLQHHGANLLALTRHLSNGPLDQVTAPDKIYFNLLGDWLVHYPMGLDWLWMALLTAAFVSVLVIGFRRQLVTIGQLLGGVALYLLIIGLVGSFCYVVNLGLIRALPYTHLDNGTYQSAMFFIAYTLVTVGTLGLLVQIALRWLRPLSLVMSGYGLLYALTLACFIRIPAVTFLFLFPLLSALIGLLVMLWSARGQLRSLPTHALFSLVAALPTLFLLMPTIEGLFVTFDLQLPLVSMLLLCVAFTLILPLWLHLNIRPTTSRLRWLTLPVGSFGLGLVVGLIAIRREAPTADQPLHSQVAYFQNMDAKQAVWASYDLVTMDPWNRQFFTKPTTGPLTEIGPVVLDQSDKIYLKSPAPLLSVLPPTASIELDSIAGTERHLALALRSPRGAANLEVLLFAAKAGDIKRIRINGEPLEPRVQETTRGPVVDLLIFGLPVAKKITLSLVVPVGSPLQATLYDQSIGLPASLVKMPRPADVVPEQGRTSNLTVIGKSYQF